MLTTLVREVHSHPPKSLRLTKQSELVYWIAGVTDFLANLGIVENENILSFLPGIEPRFLNRRVHHIVTIPTALSRLQFEMQCLFLKIEKWRQGFKDSKIVKFLLRIKTNSSRLSSCNVIYCKAVQTGLCLHGRDEKYCKFSVFKRPVPYVHLQQNGDRFPT
jgi:hypothetical protein